MQPQAPSAPLSETRFFRGHNMIYKIKIRCNSGYRRECFSQELEQIIRTVLANLNGLQPFSSVHFNVFPYKIHCRAKEEVMCRRCGMNFQVFPFVLVVYLEEKIIVPGSRAEADLSPAACSGEERNVSGFTKEKKSEPGAPVLKRCRSDWQLEGAVVQALRKELEDESRVTVIRQQRGRPSSGDEGKDVDRQESGSGPLGEIQPETQQSTSEEEEAEESEEQGGDAQPGSETPAKPGLLFRLVSYIFPAKEN